MENGAVVFLLVIVIFTYILGFCVGHRFGRKIGEIYGIRKLFERLVDNGFYRSNISQMIEAKIPSAKEEESFHIAKELEEMVVNSTISLLNE